MSSSSTKPDVDAFELAFDTWDIAGAGQYGLQTVWLNRSNNAAEVLPPKPKYVIRSMVELIELCAENI